MTVSITSSLGHSPSEVGAFIRAQGFCSHLSNCAYYNGTGIRSHLISGDAPLASDIYSSLPRIAGCTFRGSSSLLSSSVARMFSRVCTSDFCRVFSVSCGQCCASVLMVLLYLVWMFHVFSSILSASYLMILGKPRRNFPGWVHSLSFLRYFMVSCLLSVWFFLPGFWGCNFGANDQLK